MQTILTQFHRTPSPWSLSRYVFPLLLAVSVVIARAACVLAVEALTQPLVFAGSSGSMAPMKVLVEAYRKVHPEVNLEVPPSLGSAGAIRAVAEGAISVGLIARPLHDDEQKLGLTVIPYTRTVMVIGVHPTVVDDGITSEDLVQIYKKTKTRWQDGHEIVILTRQPDHSAITVVEQALPGFKEAYVESQQARRWTTLYTDQDMHRLLAKTPYAMGFSDLGAMTIEHLPIKALKVNGVLPTEEHVRSGQYPLVRTLAFVFRQDTLAPEAKAFIDFTRSAAGQAILRTNGYLPSE